MQQFDPRNVGAFDFRLVDLQETVEGIEMPDRESTHDEAFEFAANFSARFQSLDWIARHNPKSFGPALLTFSRRRRGSVRGNSELIPTEGWRVLARVPIADHLRSRIGVSWDPLLHDVDWPSHIYLAVDDLIRAIWMLRVGLTIPAALIVRTLLERWTQNVAFHWKVERLSGERDQEFISRAWRVYEHRGVPNDVGAWWAWLSELLHGRPANDAFGSQYARHISNDPDLNRTLHAPIAQVADLVLRQIRGALATVIEETQEKKYFDALQADLHPDLPPLSEPFPLSDAFTELHFYGAFQLDSERWVQLASIYRDIVAGTDRSLEVKLDPVMTVESFLERRGRAIERARTAFRSEQTTAGEDFEPGILMARLFRYETTREVARLIAPRLPREEQNALESAAQAQDGATRLWLEDSDFSMGCLRVLLEQTARLRTHRLKPARASRLEQSQFLSPSRWIEAAGWGRLSALTLAVNEFAHLTIRTRRTRARALMGELQGEHGVPETVRGNLLDRVSVMFAFEVHALLEPLSPSAAEQFTEQSHCLTETNTRPPWSCFLRKRTRHAGLTSENQTGNRLRNDGMPKLSDERMDFYSRAGDLVRLKQPQRAEKCMKSQA